jgi:diguanylate cyclase (GGDEF)-like protein
MVKSNKSNLRLFAVAWPFVAIIVVQTLLAAFSLQMVSSLRAYVSGESMWSKGQHDALYYLNRYVTTNDPAQFEKYRAAIDLPLGDRDARLALEANPPDLAAAFDGFLRGGNHPDDIPGLIWVYQNFAWFPYMQESVRNWHLAEEPLLELVALAESIGDPTQLTEQVHEDLRTQLDVFNTTITPLTKKFSDSLGVGIRFVQQALLIANLAIAAGFVALTVYRLNAFLSHRRTIEAQLSWNANHDDLTHLPNRRLFEADLGRALKLEGSPHALLFIDLDQFKTVNDSGGHAAGDELLRRVAADLLVCLRDGDLLARLGGDEFGLVLPNCTPSEAQNIAERLRSKVEAIDFSWNGQQYAVSASIGLVHLGDRGLSLQEALRAADLTCYIAKEKGRNRVHVDAPDDSAQSLFTSSLAWVQRLHRALEHNDFRLFAQAIVPVAAHTAEPEHWELLLRLEDNGRLVPPGAFIPAAERFGLMPAIDRWVVRHALAAIRTRNGGSYSINLSGVTLADHSFLPYLRDQLQRTGVSPSALCFEVTETSAIANLDDAVCFIEAMRAMGCRFALDDFGVGMSSLTYLKRLPVDYVKIDGSFVRHMLEDRADRATVEMINQISHLSGKKTVAEFVENFAILDALGEIGVDYAQGYAISRPVPLEEATLSTSIAAVA